MNQKNFVISDHHFGHNNIITFKDDKGEIIRSFSTREEHDEHIIEQHNKVVRDVDKIYMLGDVVINKKYFSLLERLKGHKILLRGNHDIFDLKYYLPYFKDIRAYKFFPKHGIILSHIPLHPRQFSERWRLNVHGHLHLNIIDDKRYMNVCMEHTNYKPVDLDQIINDLRRSEQQ